MAKDRKKVTQENKHFYKLGYMNGENRLQKTIEALKKANHYLWEELTRLDQEEPRGGVIIDNKTLRGIVKALHKKDSKHLIRKIEAKKVKQLKAMEHRILMSL